MGGQHASVPGAEVRSVPHLQFGSSLDKWEGLVNVKFENVYFQCPEKTTTLLLHKCGDITSPSKEHWFCYRLTLIVLGGG